MIENFRILSFHHLLVQAAFADTLLRQSIEEPSSLSLPQSQQRFHVQWQ